MVDFRKKLKTKKPPVRTNPVDIYDFLDRKSETGPLRPSQKTILERWNSDYRSRRDNIIKLHTGEGKTLIGLLILLSKINSSEGPCMFVCPNKYLVDQVCAEAEKFGIPYCQIDGHGLPDEFVDSKKILIVHVQVVFSGKTRFELWNKSFKVKSVVLDDSHACIDSIRSNLTVKVKKDHPLYQAMISLFEDELKNQGEGSFFEIIDGDYNTMLPIPYWAWDDKKDEVIRHISEYRESEELIFAWPVLKNQLANCQAFVSGHSLEISPTLMPIDAFGSFDKAECRILMSATTQNDSFFIKGLGFEVASVKDPLTDESMRWSGEKMILFPSLIDESLDRDSIVNWLLKPNNQRTSGMVSLIPGFKYAGQYEKIGAKVANSSDIFEHVKNLKEGLCTYAVAFANRYDGIDLPDNSCRILLIDSKPFFDSLLDRYEESGRMTSDIVNLRIAQKVEQGLGRSVRGEKDYSVILIVGWDIVNFIKSPMTQKYFSPQTRRQIEIGKEVVEFAQEEAENINPQDVLLNLVKQSLGRDDGWKLYYNEGMDELVINVCQSTMPDILKKEYQCEHYFSLGEYPKACELGQDLVDTFAGDPIERGWYLQQLARYKYRISKTDSNNLQMSAFKNNTELLKPRDGVTYKKIDFVNQNRVTRIKEWFAVHENYESAMLALEATLQDLVFGVLPDKFERALKDIGQVMGFISQRPDKVIGKGPDNLWCGIDNHYFLIECKNEVHEDRLEVSKKEIGQMNNHCGWFDDEYGEASCTRILIIPTKKVSYHGHFTHTVFIMRKGRLNKLKRNIKAFVKEFSLYNIHEISDQKISEWLQTHHLNLGHLKTQYCEEPLKQAN